jgi:protein-S-isoprenylcysteine O-methyltransferase
MSLTRIVWAVTLLWPIAEILYARRHRAADRGASVQDRGTLGVLWIVIAASITAGSMLARVPAGRLPIGEPTAAIAALALLALGLGLRVYSIVTLGRFFTVDVAVHEGQRVITAGPYRWIRHPSYLGMLIAFLGLALLTRNWISALVMIVPVKLAILRRISVEEAALKAALGAEYDDYCRRTARLVPGLY